MSAPAFLPSSLLWLRLGVAFAVALPLALFGAGSWMAHRDALRTAQVRLDDLTRVMEEHAERALETNAMVFNQVQRVLGGDSEARIRAREAQLHELLSAICERLPHIRSITVWSADGRILVSSTLYPVPRSLGAADWAEYRAAPTANGWNISPLLRDASTDEHYFRVSQARSRANGVAGGVIELAMQPSHFTDFYGRLTKREDQVSFRLVTGDGYVVARWPGAPQAGLRANDETYGAFRGVGPYPLFVSASQPPQVVFEPWRQQTTVLGAIALPSAAALLYASLLALRRTRRLREEAESRARAEEALLHSQKMEALGELTGGVAHDFNNLMMVVSNNAHLIEMTVPQAKDNPALASILRAVDSGSRLTRQLLTFSRRQPLHPELIDLQHALPGMLDLLRSTTGTGVVIGLHVAPDTPPLSLDRAELEMALINLAANARDAMNRSGQLEILARAAEPGEGPEAGRRYAIISVSDTGHGIDPQNMGRVFDPFFTTKPAGSGTGLGLSQVYGFCRQAGGGVQLESDVGVGTTVSLFLPAAQESVALAQAKPGPSELDARVLLVEDNADVSNALGSLLKGFGCTVTPVASADEAERELDEQSFDVVLSDVVMPGSKDGIAFALDMRSRRPELPIVLMTGYAKETERARAAGIEVLTKPCAPEEVSRALARALGSSRAVTKPVRWPSALAA